MLKKLVLSFFIFFSSFLYSTELNVDYYQLALITGESSANIANIVNALTGSFFIFDTDFMVQGTEPINVHPFYISKNRDKQWQFLHHLEIKIIDWDQIQIAFLREPSGASLFYDCCSVGKPKKIKKDKTKKDENRKIFNENHYGPMTLFKEVYQAGLSNCSCSGL